MNTAKLVSKLEAFLHLPKKKQLKKHARLAKIIGKLEAKKASLEIELAEADGQRYLQLQQELQVVSELIHKARQQDQAG